VGVTVRQFSIDWLPCSKNLVFNSLLKNDGICHPEEPQAAKDLLVSLILHLPGCFVSLSMTRPKRFSTSCKS
jgi:hypothetical protein